MYVYLIRPSTDEDIQPAYIDAAKNLNGVGIDDRKFLVCILAATAIRLLNGTI